MSTDCPGTRARRGPDPASRPVALSRRSLLHASLVAAGGLLAALHAGPRGSRTAASDVAPGPGGAAASAAHGYARGNPGLTHGRNRRNRRAAGGQRHDPVRGLGTAGAAGGPKRNSTGVPQGRAVDHGARTPRKRTDAGRSANSPTRRRRTRCHPNRARGRFRLHGGRAFCTGWARALTPMPSCGTQRRARSRPAQERAASGPPSALGLRTSACTTTRSTSRRRAWRHR